VLGPSGGAGATWAMANPQNAIISAKLARVAFILFLSFS
jgi:hypothetical protein